MIGLSTEADLEKQSTSQNSKAARGQAAFDFFIIENVHLQLLLLILQFVGALLYWCQFGNN
jgi:hypothetical protein